MGSCARYSRFSTTSPVPSPLFFYEHGCTGFTGREVPAPEAGWGDDPVRACGCSGCQASRFLKNPVHPVYPCQSIFLLWRPNPDAGNHRVSFPVPDGPFLNPFSFTRTRGAFPLSGSRAPSFFVCLRGPSCNFVDSSFLSLFQAKINKMLDVSSTRLFTLHSPLFTVVSGSRAGAVLHHGGKETLRPGL